MLLLARLSGGGVASFEASRLATGYHNANRFEIHGDRGALRFNFERLNELDFYDLGNDAAVQGWTTVDVTRGGDGHPYVDAWVTSTEVTPSRSRSLMISASTVSAVIGSSPVVGSS